jgi:hypothetical protein
MSLWVIHFNTKCTLEVAKQMSTVVAQTSENLKVKSLRFIF